MKRQGIPTTHNHRLFRSRLEARWAAFFDLLGWRHEYEPFDLNGWIPDFLLLGHTPVLVEVKPVTSFPEGVASKIDNSGVEDGQDVLIVGCTVPVPSYMSGDYHSPLCFGWLREHGYVEDGVRHEGSGWGDAILGRWDAGDGVIGFCHGESSFADRISGGYDGGRYGNGRVGYDERQRLWADAGNRTQWKSPA